MSRTRLVMSLVLAGQRCPSVSPNPAVRDFDGCGRSSSRDDACRRFTSHHKSFLYQCDPVSPRFPPLGIAYLAVIDDLADMHERDDPGSHGFRTGGLTVDCEFWQIPTFRMLERKAI